MCVCVCVCVRACMHVCMHVCMRMHACTHMHVCDTTINHVHVLCVSNALLYTLSILYPHLPSAYSTLPNLSLQNPQSLVPTPPTPPHPHPACLHRLPEGLPRAPLPSSASIAPSAGTGPQGNTMVPPAAMAARGSSGAACARITSTPAASTATALWTRTRGTSAVTVASASASAPG